MIRLVALIGLSGSGKSSLGQALAERFSMPFLDTDLLVEERAGMPIRRIFELRGEEFFRDLETRVVREIAERPAIIATGGGVVLRQENIQALRQNGFVIFLDRPVERILENVRYDKSRPLLSSPEKLREMEQERRALYQEAAHATLRNNADLEEGVDKLVELAADVLIEAPSSGYSVIGYPIEHTLSPVIHGTIFDAIGISISSSYSAIRVPRGALRSFTEKARVSGLRGFNVTLPHKRDIIPFLDAVDDEARLCGAVNTVVVDGGRLSGFNTDMEGLLASLRDNGHEYRNRNVVILGAGGASRGVVFKAALEKAAKIVILSRRREKAEEIASEVERAVAGCHVRACRLLPDALAEAAGEADILINATPMGMIGIGEDFSSLEFLRSLPRDALVCDLVYDPPLTNLLREAWALGHAVQNGLGMLVHQAILADELFLGRQLDRSSLYQTVYTKLSNEGLTQQ
ncbi:MAG: shikimate dehydrogenase [Synergistaceae bacterium]|jgi:shikimate dehydrogenase|nr:shikimate dehydrogenase [Synergistaceae bacterium]